MGETVTSDLMYVFLTATVLVDSGMAVGKDVAARSFSTGGVVDAFLHPLPASMMNTTITMKPFVQLLIEGCIFLSANGFLPWDGFFPSHVFRHQIILICYATFSTMSRKSTCVALGIQVTFGMIDTISPSRLFRNCSNLL